VSPIWSILLKNKRKPLVRFNQLHSFKMGAEFSVGYGYDPYWYGPAYYPRRWRRRGWWGGDSDGGDGGEDNDNTYGGDGFDGGCGPDDMGGGAEGGCGKGSYGAHGGKQRQHTGVLWRLYIVLMIIMALLVIGWILYQAVATYRRNRRFRLRHCDD
jgi:hypothetical protein